MGSKTQTKKNSTLKARRRQQHLRQKRRQRIFIAAVIVILIAVIYLAFSVFFMRHFLPHTVVNGISCSGKTTEQRTVRTDGI
ncbi:MAG: hypothetical protein LUG27_06825 [Clostridiales bacterium]|nr:hypothetical protein [Clostridiales bacterium]